MAHSLACLPYAALCSLYRMFVSMLTNNHMPVRTFFVSDDHVGVILNDGKFTNEVVEFFKKQDEVAQVTVDQKDMLPAHPKSE